MSFLQNFAPLYRRDPARALLYFLNTCRPVTKQFFQQVSKKTVSDPIEQHTRYFAHALLFQKNPLQAYCAGNYLAQLLLGVHESMRAQMLVQVRRDLTQLQLMSSERWPQNPDSNSSFYHFAEHYKSLFTLWGVRCPPLHWLPILPPKSSPELASSPQASSGKVHFVDLLHATNESVDLSASKASLHLFCFDSVCTLLQCLQLPQWAQLFTKRNSKCGFWVLEESLPAQTEAQILFFAEFGALNAAKSVAWPPAAKSVAWPPAAKSVAWPPAATVDNWPIDACQRALLAQVQIGEQWFDEIERVKWETRDWQLASLLYNLGPRCLISAVLSRESARWLATWKVGLRESALRQFVESRLAACANSPSPRQLPSHQRPRLVHVVSQIVDQRHSPTQLLRQLIALRDRQKLDSFVVSTERLAMRPGEYPLCEQISPSSCERGERTLAWFKEQGVESYIENSQGEWEGVLEHLRDQIQSLRPDILVFHGPDLIHMLLARLFPTTLNVLFEHGSLPEWPGFDLMIASTEDAERQCGAFCEKIGMKLEILPFCVDRRAQWSTKAITKRILGVEETDRCAITISNHLEARLSTPFCQAVTEILRACPDLHYCPIGEVRDESKLRECFGQDVQVRLHFYGSCQTPGNLARAADFYFNEFPWGGCLGILDAMAAGCPVVSLYDPAGPPQGRYGGLFMGLDFAARDSEEYVHMAKRLYNEPLFYFRASQRAFARYEGKSNLQAYVTSIERAVVTSWMAKCQAPH